MSVSARLRDLSTQQRWNFSNSQFETEKIMSRNCKHHRWVVIRMDIGYERLTFAGHINQFFSSWKR